MSSNQTNNMERSVKYQYLKEDPQIPGQRFAVVSFAEPTNQDVVVNREAFVASRFLKVFIEEHLQAVEYMEKNVETPEAITPEIKEKADLSYENIQKMFYLFRQLNFGKLQSEFEKLDEQNEQLSMRAFKVRGVYYTQEEATERCHEMVKFEPAVDVFTAKVGAWLPFNPVNIQDITVEHMDDELNTLIKSKVDEDTKRKLEFQERKQKAIESIDKTNVENEDEVMDDSAPVELSALEDELFDKESPETQQVEEEQSSSDDGFKTVSKKRRRRKNRNKRNVNKKH
jgi:hypothetical protein